MAGILEKLRFLHCHWMQAEAVNSAGDGRDPAKHLMGNLVKSGVPHSYV
jgi:hypothetical protein